MATALAEAEAKMVETVGQRFEIRKYLCRVFRRPRYVTRKNLLLDAKVTFLPIDVDGPNAAVHTPNQLDDRNTATIEIVNNLFSPRRVARQPLPVRGDVSGGPSEVSTRIEQYKNDLGLMRCRVV